MKQNKKIAVTGGIGSGKSTVMRLISERGFPVFSCDEIYAELLTDAQFLDCLHRNFGDVLNSDGTLNKSKLSQLVFADKTKLDLLDRLTHPEIFKKMFARADNIISCSFFEVPVLFERGYQKYFDEVIVVLRDKCERIRSVMQRDQLAEEIVLERVKNQFNYENSNFEKYYAIHNNGTLSNLNNQIDKFLEEYL